MSDKVVSINTWQKSKSSAIKTPKIYLTKTRHKGYCRIAFLQENENNQCYELDFHQGKVAEAELKDKINEAEWVEISYPTAMSLLKEAYDRVLSKGVKLKAKDAAYYDSITNYLLHNADKKTDLLPIYSFDWHQSLETLKEILLFNDFGLFYELADEKIRNKAENKHNFIHQKNIIGEGNSIVDGSIDFAEPEKITNELGEEVLAGIIRWEMNTAENLHCQTYAYYELILKQEGYWLNRFIPLDTYKLSFKEELRTKSYLEKYFLPDGRWLIKPLSDDENLLLSGEKEYYQIYEFLLAKENSSAKIILSSKEMWLCADSKEKVAKLREYLSVNLLNDMPNLFLLEEELKTVELVQILLKFNM